MEDTRDTVSTNNPEELSEAAAKAVADDELSLEIHWYVIHTYSGYENKVKLDIERMAQKKGWWGSLILDIQIPVETIVEPAPKRQSKKGAEGKDADKKPKEKVHTRKIYPGYVMIKMHINEETWYYVRNTRGVTGFVGTGNEPVPLTDEEVVKMQIEQLQIKIDIEVGDLVTVLNGPFSGMSGKVIEVIPEKNEVVVEIVMFGKVTPLRTESYYVKKI